MSLKKVFFFLYFFPHDLTHFSIFVKWITCLKTLTLITKPIQLITGSRFCSWDVSYANNICISRKIRMSNEPYSNLDKSHLYFLLPFFCVNLLTEFNSDPYSSHQTLLLSADCFAVINAALKSPGSWICLNIFFCCWKTSTGPRNKFRCGLLCFVLWQQECKK